MGCRGLKSITIPSSVKKIGKSAFHLCTGLTEIDFNATAMGNLGCDDSVFHRAGIDESGITVHIGANVTKIPDYLFSVQEFWQYAPKITRVVFAGNSRCTDIGEDAFCGCRDLMSITIPSSVTSIGDNAFYKCGSLESITIPPKVTRIGAHAFRNCNLLTSITIPSSVTHIGAYAFADCSELTTLYYHAANLKDTEKGSNIFADSGREDTGIAVTIGADVKKIPECLFACYDISNDGACNPQIKSVTFERNSSCTAIGDHAFAGCDYLKNVIIPDSVNSIGAYAFASCFGLVSLFIGKGVTSIGEGAFEECTQLATLSIGKGVTSIGDNAFEGCTPESVHIEDLSAWCRISFGLGASNPLSGAKTVYVNQKPTTDPVIPEGVDHISPGAFAECSALTSVTLPSSIKSIGGAAFKDCSGLEAIYITDVAAWCGISFTNESANPLYCAEHLYLNGQLVTELSIPEGVTRIGSYTFAGCTFDSITMPSTMQEIGEDAFLGCISPLRIICDKALIKPIKESMGYEKHKAKFKKIKYKG